MNEGISFQASIYKIQTLIDGGCRISFDVPQSDSKQVFSLATLTGELLHIGVVPEHIAHQEKNES